MKAILACTNEGLIGVNGKLPWNFKEDLEYFKSKTKNKKVLMGYKTFKEIYDKFGAGLPERTNFVLTRSKRKNFKNVIFINNINDISKKDLNDIFLIGGGTLYNILWEFVTEAFITFVNINDNFKGEKTFFNLENLSDFSIVSEKESNNLKFRVYKKNESINNC